MPAKNAGRDHGQPHPQKRRGRARPAPVGPESRHDDDQAQYERLPPRAANIGQHRNELPGGAGRGIAGQRRLAQQGAKLEDHHHRADAAGKARDHDMRHLGDVAPRRSTQKIIRKTAATRHTLAAPPGPSARTAAAMNGTVALAVPPIRTGLRPEQGRDRGRQNRREEAELRRQTHQPGEGQAVRESDQGGDEATRSVSHQAVPSIDALRGSPALSFKHSSRGQRQFETWPSHRASRSRSAHDWASTARCGRWQPFP